MEHPIIENHENEEQYIGARPQSNHIELVHHLVTGFCPQLVPQTLTYRIACVFISESQADEGQTQWTVNKQAMHRKYK